MGPYWSQGFAVQRNGAALTGLYLQQLETTRVDQKIRYSSRSCSIVLSGYVQERETGTAVFAESHSTERDIMAASSERRRSMSAESSKN
jgi:hypothetical protein